MKNVVDEFVRAGVRERVKIMIGGEPLDEKVREFVGADYYGADAMAGVKICSEVYSKD